MSHTIRVQQLVAAVGDHRSFVNVDDGRMGTIGLYGTSYDHMVIVLVKDHQWALRTFVSIEWFSEWWAENAQNWSLAYKITKDGVTALDRPALRERPAP